MRKIVNVIFLGILNENERIYTKVSCNQIIEQYNERVGKLGVQYGELQEYNLLGDDISMKNVSHKVTKLWLENGILKAEIETLNNRKGKELADNFDDYVFSTRSIGYIKQNGAVDIKKFISIDAIDKKLDAYYKYRLREKKLKRILNGDNV